MRVPQFILVAFLLLDIISAQDTTTTSSTAASASNELPITNTLVFIQSGEATESSINIMARCNNEEDSAMSLVIIDNIGGEDITQEADVTSDTDFTNTFVVEGLSPDTYYTYVVQCIVGGKGISVYESAEGLFKTVPSAYTVKAVSFVWVSCLSGQGYGRNPDFEITNADGETVKGEFCVSWYLFICLV
jgi:alkaline phosphatase D